MTEFIATQPALAMARWQDGISTSFQINTKVQLVPMAPQDSVIQIEDLPRRLDPWKDLVPGYPRLAGQMGRLPQLGVFRRFGALNMRSLLYYQAELAQIEQDLIQTELEDARNTQDLQGDYCGNWADLSGSTTDHNQEFSGEQWELVLKMRKLLKEYSKIFKIGRAHV